LGPTDNGAAADAKEEAGDFTWIMLVLALIFLFCTVCCCVVFVVCKKDTHKNDEPMTKTSVNATDVELEVTMAAVERGEMSEC